MECKAEDPTGCPFVLRLLIFLSSGVNHMLRKLGNLLSGWFVVGPPEEAEVPTLLTGQSVDSNHSIIEWKTAEISLERENLVVTLA